MKNLTAKFPFLLSPYLPWIFFAGAAVIASIHRIALGTQSFNNYVIFERSFFHLLDGTNLYIEYPDEQYDLYKYSPTFAFLMAPLGVLPRFAGLIIWNTLNMLAPVWAVSRLKLSQQNKTGILLLVFIELLSSVQNAQSNGLMLGLMIGAFAMFEQGKNTYALLLICAGFYIKLFAAAAAVMLLFYPGKIKSLISGFVFLVLFAALPLVAVSWENLMTQYGNWITLLGNDPAHELNYSFMTLMERTAGIHIPDIYYLMPGLILLLLPLIRTTAYSLFNFRFTFLSSLLIWVVIFNHKAESPTFCIALGGIAGWYITGTKTSWRNILMIAAFVLVALSPTDLFPRFVRDNYINPYSLKALMPVVIWFVIIAELLFLRYEQDGTEPLLQKQTA